MAILREAAAGVAVARCRDLRRKHGVSRPTFYLWTPKYGGAGGPALQRLKALEQENAKRKRMEADHALDMQMHTVAPECIVACTC